MVENMVKEYLLTTKVATHDIAALKNAVKSGIDILNATESAWEALFSSYTSSNERVLGIYKTSLKKFLTWAQDHGCDTKAALEALINYKITIDLNPSLFFGSYSELKESLDKVVSPTVDQYRTYILEMCLYSLAWFGVDFEECLNLLKEDVEIQSPSFCILHLPGRTKEIKRPDVIKLLEEYKQASTFDYGYSRIGYYQPSKYLFRTMVNAKLESKSACVRQTKLNGVALEAGSPKFFYFPNVRISAIYARVFDILSSVGYAIVPDPMPQDWSRFEQLFNEQYSRSIQFKTRYNEFYSWCRIFRSAYFQ